jgi:uncharacterized membrane protein HdeD (DUF308 family)
MVIDHVIVGDMTVRDERSAQLRSQWAYLLIAGIVSVLLGLVILAWRSQTLYALVYFAGAVFLFIGILHVIDAFVTTGDRWLPLLTAAVFLTTGIIMLPWPHVTLFITALLIALDFLLWGVLQIVKALEYTTARLWWVGLIAGVGSILIAVWTVRHPGHALVVLMTLLGIWIMLSGIVEIIAAFAVRHAFDGSEHSGRPIAA